MVYPYMTTKVKLFNRVTKIHENEFEVLPKAWELLQTALGQIGHMASLLQTYPDFKWMAEAELEEFTKTTKLKKHEIEELKSSPDKNECVHYTPIQYDSIRFSRITI